MYILVNDGEQKRCGFSRNRDFSGLNLLDKWSFGTPQIYSFQTDCIYLRPNLKFCPCQQTSKADAAGRPACRQATVYVSNNSPNTGNLQIKDYYLQWVPTGPSFGQVSKDYVTKSVKSGTIYFKDQLLHSIQDETLWILKEAAVTTQKAVI